MKNKNLSANKRMTRIIVVSVIIVCAVLSAILLTKQGRAEEIEKQNTEPTLEPVSENAAEQSVNEVPNAVYEAAEDYVKKHFESAAEEYSDWRISGITYTYSYENFCDMKLLVYQFNYEFLAIHPENVLLTGGMSMDEEGWVVPGYPNSMYLIFEERDGELIYVTAMMENDCEPGDEIFTNDLEHQCSVVQDNGKTAGSFVCA